MIKMEKLIEIVKKSIPNTDSIIGEIWDSLALSDKMIQEKFGDCLVFADRKGLEIFSVYEKKAIMNLAKEWLMEQDYEIRKKLQPLLEQKDEVAFVDEISKIFAEFGFIVQKLEKDLGIMRKARGGMTFEKNIIWLLNHLNINCEKPKKKEKEKLGRIDIIIPSAITAIRTPDRAFFLTCKRTLRERWKQEIPQAKINQRFYLLTIDEDIAIEKAKEIHSKGLIAFVREDVAKHSGFKKMYWMRSLNDLP